MELPAFLMDPVGDILGSVEGIAFTILAALAIIGALGTVYALSLIHISEPTRPY